MSASVLSPEIFAMLVCPVCRGGLVLDENFIRCIECGRRYPVEDGIPILLAERATGPSSQE
jgi:uncharacterized protein YbaR (Trm112 family)